jgi:hypothetical protein
MKGVVTPKFRPVLAIDIPHEGKPHFRSEISEFLYYLKAEFPEYGFP